MNECKFEIGDLVVEKGADYFNSIKICKVEEIECMNPSNPMWDPDFDTENFWLITTKIVYHVKQKKSNSMLWQVGDYESFEDWELEPLSDYLNRRITIDDYIDVKYNGKSFYEEDEK